MRKDIIIFAGDYLLARSCAAKKEKRQCREVRKDKNRNR